MRRAPTETRAIFIRDAAPGDCERIRKLLTELGYPPDPATLSERLERAGAEPTIRLFVAELDGAVVGFASLHVLHLIERPPLGRLSAIVVSATSRRGGVGRALVDRVEREARAAGCDRLEVTSGEWRFDAHAFYGDLGFEETSKRFIKGL